MGLFDDLGIDLAAIAEEENKFKPQELTEGNVRAIFNRCLAKDGTTEKVSSILYYRELGYENEDLGVSFDKNALAANRKNIEYLYGQLAAVHEGETILKEDDFTQSYSGRAWTEDQASAAQMMYLGSSETVKLLTLFNAKRNGAGLYALIKPTLSPKAPAFPAWWEAHRAEWED